MLMMFQNLILWLVKCWKHYACDVRVETSYTLASPQCWRQCHIVNHALSLVHIFLLALRSNWKCIWNDLDVCSYARIELFSIPASCKRVQIISYALPVATQHKQKDVNHALHYMSTYHTWWVCSLLFDTTWGLYLQHSSECLTVCWVSIQSVVLLKELLVTEKRWGLEQTDDNVTILQEKREQHEYSSTTKRLTKV